MRALISSIGSRGDVQPILALALELKALGHTATLCVAPNFKSWVESFGIACIPVGPDLRQFVNRSSKSDYKSPSRRRWKEINRPIVRNQFDTTTEAARGCDAIVIGGALQTAGHSIAQALKIPYVYAAYSPASLPSPDHPPPMKPPQPETTPDNRNLWRNYMRRWHLLFADAVNEQRAARALAPVTNVPRYVMTDRPWLAADPELGPAPKTIGTRPWQTGAWILSDHRPLPDAVEQFLAAGEPPIYFGFGSMGAAPETSGMLIRAARTLERRAIISQGWADLKLIDSDADCLSIDDINHQHLLPRVAAIVHHGGAGTTAAAARAGIPQLVIPHLYDQFYWAKRVTQLGIGLSPGTVGQLSLDLLVTTLRECLKPGPSAAARDLAPRIELHGAAIAAQRLVREWGPA